MLEGSVSGSLLHFVPDAGLFVVMDEKVIEV